MVKVPSNIPRDLFKTTKALTEGSGTVSAEWDESDWPPMPIVDDTSNDEMPDPTRVYYTLSDFAAKWGKTVDDLLQMAAAGALELSVRCSGRIYDPDKSWELKHVAGYAQLSKHQTLLILDHGRTGKVSDLIDGQPVIFEGKVVYFLKNDELPQELKMPPELEHVRSLILNCIDDLLILPTEAERVVKKYPNLFKMVHVQHVEAVHQVTPVALQDEREVVHGTAKITNLFNEYVNRKKPYTSK